MPSKAKDYRFKFRHDEAFAWHIGINFCIEPKHYDGKRDIYLFFCIGKHDFSIGFMHVWGE